MPRGRIMLKESMNVILCFLCVITICIAIASGCSKYKADNISEVQAQMENKEFEFEWVYQKKNVNIGVVKDKETGTEYIFTMNKDVLFESITTQLTPRLNTDGTLYTGK